MSAAALFRPIVALSLSLGFLIGVAALAGEFAENYAAASLDLPVERSFEQLREPWVVEFMKVVTQPGSSAFLVPFVAVTGIAWRIRKGSWRSLAVLFAAYAGSLALTRAVKAVVERPRPIQEMPAEVFTGSAFPSGHAAKAAAVFFVVGALLTLRSARPARRVIVWSSAASVALVVGASRLFLGAHWLSDVLAGVAFGALWGLAVIRFAATRRGSNDVAHGRAKASA